MAQIKVSGENIFQVDAHDFCVGPSESGYTINYSGDGVHWTACTTITEDNITQVVNGAALGMYFKLVDNTDDEVIVTW